MKARSMAMTMLRCFVGLAASFAENLNMGTWKLNEAKSKLAAGMLTTMWKMPVRNIEN